jgi:hypothetical protein
MSIFMRKIAVVLGVWGWWACSRRRAAPTAGAQAEFKLKLRGINRTLDPEVFTGVGVDCR